MIRQVIVRAGTGWRLCVAALACAAVATLLLVASPVRAAQPAAQARAATPAPAAQGPAQWKVDAARSSIRFNATQAGAQFEGRFARFTPDIRFDARDLARSSARVVIDVSSVDSRSGERDTALRGGDWFDPKRWPTAVFEARRFQAQGSGFVADGQLTIRDRARPVRLSFTLRTAPDGTRTLQGQARLSRLAFGLGQGEFASTEWVGDAVTVDVTVVAR
jgi:polyisoprenoid-binding protein YceI